MRTLAVVTALFLASQGFAEDGLKELDKKLDGVEKAGSKVLDDNEAALLKKKFAFCKKTGDCDDYRSEKERVKKEKKELVPQEEGPAASEAASSIAPAEAGELASGAPADEGPARSASGPPPTAVQAEAMRRGAGERRERTMSRAAGAADAMRRSFFPTGDAAGPGGGGPPRRTAPETGSAPARAHSPPESAPAPRPIEAETERGLALAARSGYAATFRDQGLKVGSGPRGEPAIQRADGSPASPADLERLRTALRAEPAALARRPDFFEVLPRSKFADLKRDYNARPELRPTIFKDISLTEMERDFRWSSSCSVLSGGCNRLSSEGSYRKGADVPPEDLKAAWAAAREDEPAEEDDGFGEYTDEDRREAAAEDLAAEKLGAGRRKGPGLGALLARMGEFARGYSEGGGGSEPAGVRAADAHGWDSRPETSAGERRGAAPVFSRPAGPPRSPAAPPAPEGRGAAGRTWIYGLAAAAAAGLILKGLRRTR